MKRYIFIKADTNDADYISQLSPITEEEYELILPVIDAIKNFKPYDYADINFKCSHISNYPTGDFVRDDLDEKSARILYGHLEGFDVFNELRPYGEYGIHTIEEIRVLEVINEQRLL